MNPERPPDPHADAERKLRMALAAEARADHRLRGQIQKGFYGCLTIVIVLFLFALLFS
jgi:hypothetical protein